MLPRGDLYIVYEMHSWRAVSLRCGHWRQPRRGCRGHIPSNILVGGTSVGISPPMLLRTFGYSRPIL